MPFFSLPFFTFSQRAVCLCAFFTLLSTQSLTVYALSVEPREAYFNGSAYLRLKTPMLLWGHSAISFRTCRGKLNKILWLFSFIDGTQERKQEMFLHACVWVELGSGRRNIADN